MMEEYIKEIEQIAIKCTKNQSDGYSQIMRICDAMRDEQDFVHQEQPSEDYFVDINDYLDGI